MKDKDLSQVESFHFVFSQDGRVRDLSQLFQAKTIKIVEDTTKKLRIVEHLQVMSRCSHN